MKTMSLKASRGRLILAAVLMTITLTTAGCAPEKKAKPGFADIFELSLPCPECSFTAEIKREDAGRHETIKADINFMNGNYRIRSVQSPDGFTYDMIIDNKYIYALNHVSRSVIAFYADDETQGGLTKKIFLNAGIRGIPPREKKTVLTLYGLCDRTRWQILRKGTDFYLKSTVIRYNRKTDGLMVYAVRESPEHRIEAGDFIKKEGPVKEVFRIKKFKCRKQSPALFALPAGYKLILPPERPQPAGSTLRGFEIAK